MAAGSVAAILDLIPLSQALHCTDDAGGRALRVRRPTPAALDSIAGKVPARCASRALRAAAPTGELLSEVRLSAVQVEQILDQALRAAVSCRRGRDRDAGASPPSRAPRACPPPAPPPDAPAAEARRTRTVRPPTTHQLTHQLRGVAGTAQGQRQHRPARGRRGSSAITSTAKPSSSAGERRFPWLEGPLRAALAGAAG